MLIKITDNIAINPKECFSAKIKELNDDTFGLYIVPKSTQATPGNVATFGSLKEATEALEKLTITDSKSTLSFSTLSMFLGPLERSQKELQELKDAITVPARLGDGREGQQILQKHISILESIT